MLAIRRLYYVFLVSILLATSGICQKKSPIASVPSDSLELVTGATRVPDTPQERARALDLVERARQNSDLSTPGGPAYTLKVNFTASGNVQFTGSGEMEETWIGPYVFRWSARLGDFELTRIAVRGAVLDDKPTQFIPMRVHMLRDALFWPVSFNAADALIRTATAQWKGSEVTCILTSGGMSDATATPGRRWTEREYCVDTKTGLMQVLSDAPGIYVLYDYTNPHHFHGRVLAGKISIVEGGKTVLEANLVNIGDADPNNTSVLTPTQEMRNSGPVLSYTMRFPQTIHVAPGAAITQPVIVHALLGSDGKVLDAELVEDSGAALSQSALDLVKRTSYVRANNEKLQREAFINVQFVSQ
jgi:hypothetical protein